MELINRNQNTDCIDSIKRIKDRLKARLLTPASSVMITGASKERYLRKLTRASHTGHQYFIREATHFCLIIHTDSRLANKGRFVMIVSKQVI